MSKKPETILKTNGDGSFAREDGDSQAHRQGIGLRIRQRRQDIGLSLREVARRAEVTASFLSHLERGKSDTSIGVLRRIATVLGVPMMYFLVESNKRSPMVRAHERQSIQVQDEHVSYEMLVPDLARKMEAVLGRIEPGTGNIVARPLREATEEFLFVLSGSLRIELSERVYVVHAGDTIYFQGESIKSLACASEVRAVWLSVITPPVF